jgi:hypothetical protein
VSLFVASPEIEDRNAVEVSNWARHKKTSFSNSTHLLQMFAKYKNRYQNVNSKRLQLTTVYLLTLEGQ